MSDFICQGCFKEFESHWGFSLHLANSTNPLCQKFASQLSQAALHTGPVAQSQVSGTSTTSINPEPSIPAHWALEEESNSQDDHSLNVFQHKLLAGPDDFTRIDISDSESESDDVPANSAYLTDLNRALLIRSAQPLLEGALKPTYWQNYDDSDDESIDADHDEEHHAMLEQTWEASSHVALDARENHPVSPTGSDMANDESFNIEFLDLEGYESAEDSESVSESMDIDPEIAEFGEKFSSNSPNQDESVPADLEEDEDVIQGVKHAPEKLSFSIQQDSEPAASLLHSDNLQTTPRVVHYPDPRAGETIKPSEASSTSTNTEPSNPHAPFNDSPFDWELAKWKTQYGIGANAFTALLQTNDLHKQLKLSYATTKELNKIIDDKLTTVRPKFIRQQIAVAGESYDVYFRDVIQCIKALWGDPAFADQLVYAPEKHYTKEGTRMYHEVHTGNWWWRTQKNLDAKKPGGTILPLILSSDKTQLTNFDNRDAYPVYMTVANLPKGVRRKPSMNAQVLLGYLPTAALDQIEVEASKRRITSNIFHACIRKMLQPLHEAGKNGVEMMSGDGKWRRCHPIFAIFVGDYPEQTLVACVKRGECPICVIPADQVGDGMEAYARRDIDKAHAALRTITQGPTLYTKACTAAGIKPVQHPFWENLPFANIYNSITPDLLHQLYQGVIKHLIKWLREAIGDTEIDARCRRLPPNHNIRLFMQGISCLSRVTGKEHQQISHILLGLIIDVDLDDEDLRDSLIKGVRALLDFTHLAQYPLHTSATLAALKQALSRFHANKHAFVDLGIRKGWKIPKIHMLNHYVEAIENFGTTDNYNSEYTERLHIDMAKDAYRATNHRDEFPQMTLWLERREKILEHTQTISKRLAAISAKSQEASEPESSPKPPTLPKQVGVSFQRYYYIAATPSKRGVSITDMIDKHKAVQFEECLAQFIVARQNNINTPWSRICRLAKHMKFSSSTVFSTFYHLKFGIKSNTLVSSTTSETVTVDSVHAKPQWKNRQKRTIPARFDTALVSLGHSKEPYDKTDYKIAQVFVIFTLPAQLISQHLPQDTQLPKYLAYVEFFTGFTTPDENHGLYSIQREVADSGQAVARIIPVANISRSVHLLPKFGLAAPRNWSSSSVLVDADTFYVNTMSDRHIYYTIS